MLKGISLKVERGQWISIMGRSGAGKSTLMYQMSLLDDPTSGEVIIDGKDASQMSHEEKTTFRLNEFGYVFQDYALVPELNAIENVALPLLMQGIDEEKAYKDSAESMRKVKLPDITHDNLPSQLSGGEQQRVSISRAIAHCPRILFADEPTANLDSESAKAVMSIFGELHKQGQTIIMVTHEEEYGRLADRLIRLRDGEIISDEMLKK